MAAEMMAGDYSRVIADALAQVEAGDDAVVDRGQDAVGQLEGRCGRLRNRRGLCRRIQIPRGGRLCRSAGSSAVLVAREAQWAQITLPSGEIRRVPAACRATIGSIGNSEHMNVRLGKAGRSRWMGIRPHVRGTAMNPVDHPHGGGEGRTKGGRHPVSPTGKSAKGGGTRKPRKASSTAIIRRRKSRRYGQLKLR